MHILERFTLTAAFVAVLGVPGIHALTTAQAEEEKLRTMERIEEVLQAASDKERSVFQVRASKEDGLATMETAEKSLSQIMRDKRNVRLQIANKRKLAEQFQELYHVNPDNTKAVKKLLKKQKTDVQRFIARYVRALQASESHAAEFGRSILTRLVSQSLGEQVEEDLRLQALKTARLHMLSMIAEVKELPVILEVLEGQHDALLASTHESINLHDSAKEQVRLSDVQLAEIKRIDEEVSRQVRLLQAELSKYDERIRRRAERELIAKGLRSSKPAEEVSGPPDFIWPVEGRYITAGFYDPSYQRYFGVPHRAIDIRQGQGGAVRASADGVVYHVQHGGALGYSYILIGHRGGYATLYGHMLDIHVVQGQDISQGQTIGLSGGQPGTRGAGPMTTGAHLHFEVIHNGGHIDPYRVLP